MDVSRRLRRITEKRVRISRNRSALRWAVEHLPVRQTLVWAGPLFILIQPKQDS